MFIPRFKKWIPIAFMLVLVLCITACSQNGKDGATPAPTSPSASTTPSGTPEADKKPPLYTIKMYTKTKLTVKMSDETDVGKYIKDKFNIVFEYVPYVGDYNEKNNLMLATGDYPEIIELQGDSVVKKYIDAKALVPLDDFLANSPQFTEAYKQQIPLWRISEDNKLYKWEKSTPTVFEYAAPNAPDMAVRTDVLEKQGWPNLVSEDDWVSFLKKALEQFPTTNGNKTIGLVAPFGAPWGIPGIAGILYEKGGDYTGIAGNAGVIFNHTTDKYEDYLKVPDVKTSFKFFNRLYREGILDKESFTDTPTQNLEKLSSGRAIAQWYYLNHATANSALEKAGHPEMQYIRLPIRTNAQVAAKAPRLFMEQLTNPFNSVVITKNAKDPKRIFELVNWAASEEGQLMLQSGIEGIHYNIQSGKRVPTKLFVDMLKDPANAKSGYFGFLSQRDTRAKDGELFSLGSIPRVTDEFTLTDRQKEAYKKLGWSNSAEYWLKHGKGVDTGIVPSILNDPKSTEGLTEQKMTELRSKTTVRLITAGNEEEFEKIWTELNKEYEKLNPHTVVDKYNKLYQEAKAKLKK
ncbi:MAG: transporter substrate-binding protein [Paenibacillus sp.]|jgi:ABC-type glycerol-3-phosphate transport system substrate-binding protein|nr:transporter substrate-binding protein [Paenibacillus sp.]